VQESNFFTVALMMSSHYSKDDGDYTFHCTNLLPISMEECTLKSVNNCLNTNIYSYFETSGGQSSNLYLNVVNFFNTSVN
jgi:hypothetical protein